MISISTSSTSSVSWKTSVSLVHPSTYNWQHLYTFTTKAGSQYSISLNKWSELSGIPDYGSCTSMILDLTVKPQTKDINDPRIEKTVPAIALDYLQHYPEDIVVYYCLDVRGHAKARHRLFLKWFDRYNPGAFCRETRIHDDEEHVFIFDKNNENAKHFLTFLPNT